jgi:hypothetical protein
MRRTWSDTEVVPDESYLCLLHIYIYIICIFCVRACVRACVCACACACVRVYRRCIRTSTRDGISIGCDAVILFYDNFFFMIHFLWYIKWLCGCDAVICAPLEDVVLLKS